MKLQCFSDTGVTVLANAFIDQYIADANGEYVKVYLYLMRAAQGGLDISVSSIADALEHTEKDILRALRYWQKCQLLTMEEAKGQVLSIGLLAPDSSQPAPAALQSKTGAMPKAAGAQTSGGADNPPSRSAASPEGAAGSASAASGKAAETPAQKPHHAVQGSPSRIDTGSAIPENKNFSASKRKAITSKEEFKQLLFVAEQYFNRPLTPAEMNDLMYFYDTLHFSCDLIECLLECCLDKGDRGTGYMEAVARSWYTKGITTPEEAKKENKRHNESYYIILRALGISDHRPIDKEIEAMDRWMQEYGFSTEIICEACERTIMRIHKPEFSYVETILASWHKGGVQKLSDIRALDEAHSAETAAAVSHTGMTATPASRSGRAAASRSTGNRFSNFEERSFDWNALADQELVKEHNEEN